MFKKCTPEAMASAHLQRADHRLLKRCDLLAPDLTPLRSDLLKECFTSLVLITQPEFQTCSALKAALDRDAVLRPPEASALMSIHSGINKFSLSRYSIFNEMQNWLGWQFRMRCFKFLKKKGKKKRISNKYSCLHRYTGTVQCLYSTYARPDVAPPV